MPNKQAKPKEGPLVAMETDGILANPDSGNRSRTLGGAISIHTQKKIELRGKSTDVSTVPFTSFHGRRENAL